MKMIVRNIGKALNILGLEENERPVHLLTDEDRNFYLATDSYFDICTDRFRHRLFMGGEDLVLSEVDEVKRFETYRDGGTTEIDFVINSKDGHIYVPSAFKEGLSARLDFEGTSRELKKVGYDSPYLFSVWNQDSE
jgi:hypothetical protein